ncbi:MAG: hypothetical protein ACYTG2_09615 [Planctomycetota bacterium]
MSFSGSNDVLWGGRGRNVLWFRSSADRPYWSLLRRLLGQAGHGPVSEFIVEDEGRVDSALVADRLAKNVRMSAYALRLEGAPYLYALQPNLRATPIRTESASTTVAATHASAPTWRGSTSPDSGSST